MPHDACCGHDGVFTGHDPAFRRALRIVIAINAGSFVLVAALGVFGTGTRWPDLLVAAAMAGLFLNTSLGTARRALAELREGREAHHHAHG